MTVEVNIPGPDLESCGSHDLAWVQSLSHIACVSRVALIDSDAQGFAVLLLGQQRICQQRICQQAAYLHNHSSTRAQGLSGVDTWNFNVHVRFRDRM